MSVFGGGMKLVAAGLSEEVSVALLLIVVLACRTCKCWRVM
jgi:hypothetical protein